MRQFDVVVIGAGAAGMMCASVAGARGRSVLVLDHADAPGKKIRISGGGRCNFTNLNTAPDRFLSQNPRFAISALKRYRPRDFVAMVERHGIAYHEKTLGQLFCDGSAQQIIDMLLAEMESSGVELRLGAEVTGVEKAESGFVVRAAGGTIHAMSLVLATGGKSIPKMGATSFAYRIAEQFGLAVTETRPALVPLTFEPRTLENLRSLAGVSLDAHVHAGKAKFREALLFTHRGLSGPSILQASSYWKEGQQIVVDLLPDIEFAQWLAEARREHGRQEIVTALSASIPRRVAEQVIVDTLASGRVADMNKKNAAALEERLKRWAITPVGSEGYRTAEVTLGGIDTNELSSKDMQAKSVPGLFCIGEAVDVTGWLGGYNFQWAWASGWCAGQAA